MEPADAWQRFAKAPPEPWQPESHSSERAEADRDAVPSWTGPGLDPRAAYYTDSDTESPRPEPKLVQDDDERPRLDDATRAAAAAKSVEPESEATLRGMSAVVEELSAVRADLRELTVQ